MKYRVPLKITFDGYAIVDAIDEHTAEETALYNVGGVLGQVGDSNSDKVLDFEFETHGTMERPFCEEITELEPNYKKAYDDIQQVKEIIDGLSFEQARMILSGFNYDGELFDFNFGYISGTVRNQDKKPLLSNEFNIYNKDKTIAEENITENEILRSMNNERNTANND